MRVCWVSDGVASFEGPLFGVLRVKPEGAARAGLVEVIPDRCIMRVVPGGGAPVPDKHVLRVLISPRILVVER